MTREGRQKEFLDKARDADEKAELARRAQDHDTWRKIAESYRNLAKTT
jgi:hypothetical protein